MWFWECDKKDWREITLDISHWPCTSAVTTFIANVNIFRLQELCLNYSLITLIARFTNLTVIRWYKREHMSFWNTFRILIATGKNYLGSTILPVEVLPYHAKQTCVLPRLTDNNTFGSSECIEHFSYVHGNVLLFVLVPSSEVLFVGN